MILIWIALCFSLLTYTRAQNGFNQGSGNFGGGGFGGQGGGFGQGGFGQGGGFGGGGFGGGNFGGRGGGGFGGNRGFGGQGGFGGGGVGGFGGQGGFGGGGAGGFGQGGFGGGTGGFGGQGGFGGGAGGFGGQGGGFGGGGVGGFGGQGGFGGVGVGGLGGQGGGFGGGNVGGFGGRGLGNVGGGIRNANGGFNRDFTNRPVRSRQYVEEPKYPPSATYPPAAPTNEYGTPMPSTEYGVPADEYGPPDNQYGPPATEYGVPVLEYSAPSEGSASSVNPSRYARILLDKYYYQPPLFQPTQFASGLLMDTPNNPTPISSSSDNPVLLTPSPLDQYAQPENTNSGEINNPSHHPVNVNLYQPLVLPSVTYFRASEMDLPEFQPMQDDHEKYETYTVPHEITSMHELPDSSVLNFESTFPSSSLVTDNYYKTGDKNVFNPSQLMEVKGPRFEYYTLPLDQFKPMMPPYIEYQLPLAYTFKQQSQSSPNIRENRFQNARSGGLSKRLHPNTPLRRDNLEKKILDKEIKSKSH